MASSRDERFGCVFGRDTLITCLKLLRAYKRSKDPEILRLVRKALINLAQFQGKEENIESGEQPGKCIHELRKDRYEHLTKEPARPWFLYKDLVFRNYDSVDATPLLLIAFYRYWQASNDGEFLTQFMSNIHDAIGWVFNYGDSNGDGFVDYELSPKRVHGGLITQNWMDSMESVFHETEGVLKYPMAPVEVQAYVYFGFRLWADYFKNYEPALAEKLNNHADELKRRFNEKFLCQDPEGNFYLAWKLDGDGNQFKSVRSSMGHCLWASMNLAEDGRVDCIVYQEHIPAIVKRLMMPDMFEPEAGIRTLSKFSRNFKPNSYHNGSIWPHDNGMIAEGFEILGFQQEADKVKKAVLNAIAHFGSPMELYVYIDGQFSDYCSSAGKIACRYQAWTAASLLDFASS